MKIALAQLNVTIGDFSDTVDRILEIVEESKLQNAELVVFPELTLTGYPPLDLLSQDAFIDQCSLSLASLTRQIEGIAVVVGFVEQNSSQPGKPYYNAAAFILDGRIEMTCHKMLLPNYDVFDENRWFEPGRTPRVIDYKGKRIGLTICEDIWNDKDFWDRQLYRVDPVEELVEQSADFILNLSASPFTLEKDGFRTRMVARAAARHSVPIAFVNMVGGNDSLIFDGNSFAVDKRGHVIARAKAFEEDVLLLDIETPGVEHWPQREPIVMAHKALTLGLRDYLRKCGFQRVVLGLSGGIDSAVTATLAVDAIGAENVYGIAMPSKYSSEHSVADALALAENLGIQVSVIPIQPIVDAYSQQLSELFVGQPEDVTEENIQARVRGNLVMAYSNKFGALVLSTGNKSELAVGYCTLYGDMSGGLAVISDLPKTLVYQLAEQLNQDRERIPRNTIEKPPSAELRPDQLDQDSLPPYPALDAILQAYIVDHRSQPQIVALGFDTKLVEKVLRLVDRTEYKRRQAAPGLKITGKAFGHGRHLPIARKL